MPLISVSKASKQFDVSRPTLQKALKDGAITGQKVRAGGSESWQIDTAELARLYKLRNPAHGKSDGDFDTIGQQVDMKNSSVSEDLSGELAKEVETLQANLARAHAELDQMRTGQAETQKELAAAQAVAEERKRLLDDFIKLLPKPEDQQPAPVKRGLWSRLTGR